MLCKWKETSLAHTVSHNLVDMNMDKKDILETLKQRVSSFDYIRFVFCDLNGVAGGKVVTGRNADTFLEDGVGDYAGR